MFTVVSLLVAYEQVTLFQSSDNKSTLPGHVTMPEPEADRKLHLLFVHMKTVNTIC